jgi:predicted enzyme related to lactoylglutathione lyase
MKLLCGRPESELHPRAPSVMGTTTFRIVRIFRVAIPSMRHSEARAFYEHVLNMSADDTVPSRLYFHCGDVIAALINWTIEARDATFHPTPDDLYFATNELDAVYDRAVKAGAQITSPIETWPWGERAFYCRDLDDNKLCFVDDSTLFLGRGAPWS